ncbi:M23 family metallopeptidase [Gammaproteobacteria bacterium LSUCC0112]|nr:M23 family metallopeptidase [Gammaproteobacteria bacterium LSUCC0112]
MKLDCIIYTTSKASKLRKDLDLARAILLKTKGREDVVFTVVEFQLKGKLPTVKDTDGDVVLDWKFLKKLCPAVNHNAVGFHFTTKERTKWGVKKTLNGAYHRDVDSVLDFWVCADPGKKAKHYPYSDFLRILIHEITHGDVHWTGADRNLVHEWDYEKRRIHDLPATLSYEKWNFLTAIVKQLTEQYRRMTEATLVHPLPKKYQEKVTQSFLSPSAHYLSGVHNGTDFGCPVGTPVVAPCDGEVYYRAIDHPSLGNAVYFRFIYKGSTYHARFLHLSIAGRLGAYKRGEVVGETGNTGDSTGPHLHLDLWNRAIDTSIVRSRAGVIRYMLDPVVFLSGAK